jgi:competence protein ComEA
LNQWLEEHRTLVFALVGLLVAGSAGLFAVRYRAPAPITIVPPQPTSPPLPTVTPGPIHVYVSGAVNRPAVYELPPNSLAQDAVIAAGGQTAEADLSRVNLAQTLHEGDQVHVPVFGEVSVVGSDGSVATPTPSGPINLNTATLEELEWLPGIGPSLAQRIVDYRDSHGTFTSIEQVMNVSGIGPGKFDGIRDLIVVCTEGDC